MISAKVVLDSVSPDGVRITTLELCYPRYIMAELNTHRVFSRNSASSRAIPVKKMIEMIRTNPVMPIYWGENKPGMQAGDEIENVDLAKALWLETAEVACQQAEKLLELNVHKQTVNRIIENYMYVKTLVTATEWDNFFTLRDHPDAQPEIRELAIQMKNVMCASTPKLLSHDEWHMPYVRSEEQNLDHEMLLKVSTARCARVSYLTHDGQNPDLDKDVLLYDRLVGSFPPHQSPLEHQAKPNTNKDEWSGNFRGWIQHRKVFEANIDQLPVR